MLETYQDQDPTPKNRNKLSSRAKKIGATGVAVAVGLVGLQVAIDKRERPKRPRMSLANPLSWAATPISDLIEGAPPTATHPHKAKAEAPAPPSQAETLTHSQKLVEDIKAGRPISYLHGSLNFLAHDKVPRVVLNPIMRVREGIRVAQVQEMFQDYEFFAVSAHKDAKTGKTTIGATQIDIDGDSLVASLGGSTTYDDDLHQVIIHPAKYKVGDAERLFDPGTEAMYGMKLSSFNYTSAAGTNMVLEPRTEQDESYMLQEPVGVLLTGHPK